MSNSRSRNSASVPEIEDEQRRLILVEKAKEKLRKYKLSCSRLEAKKGLEPLKTVDGKPVQNAIMFNQWEKQLTNWMKTVNVYWAVDPNTTEERKLKHSKHHKRALETLYICLESAVVDPVAKAEVQDECWIYLSTSTHIQDILDYSHIVCQRVREYTFSTKGQGIHLYQERVMGYTFHIWFS